MTIHLSSDREQFIRSLVLGGRYASEDDVVEEAFRLLKEQERHRQSLAPGLGSIGAMREDAEFLDEIVENAMKARQHQPWRLAPGE